MFPNDVHFVYLLGLVCWIGSVVFFSFFTAPVIFKLLDREKAGEIVGVIFPRNYFLGYVCAAVVLFSLMISDPNIFKAKSILLFVMIVGWFYAGMIVSPKSRKLKALRQAASSMDEKENFEAQFKKVHSLAVKLNGTVLVAGLGLLWFSAEGFQL